MGFVLDIFPPSPETEAAAALGLAVAARKGKGLLGRKPGETVEVLTRVTLNLNTITWQGGDNTSRVLVYDPAALVGGSVRFALEAGLPEFPLGDETSEEAYLAWTALLTKEAVAFKALTLDFPGLITQPEQVAPLLKGSGDNSIAAQLEENVVGAEFVTRLEEQLAAYGHAREEWSKLLQKAFSLRDQLITRLEQEHEETKAAGDASLEALTKEIEAATATKREEVEAAIEDAKERFGQRKEMLMKELARYQEEYKEKADDYWRNQIKGAEKALADNEKDLEKNRKGIDAAFEEFRKAQQAKLSLHQGERDKRLAAIDVRRKRLDAALEGLGKALEKRQASYQSQEQMVTNLTLELPTEKADTSCPLVFVAARFSGNRWQVFAPQVSGSRGLAGTITGLVGGVNLPFKNATKLAETLAEKLEKLIPTTPALAERLEEASQLKDPEFLALAKAGLSRLIDQGALDKKHATLFNDL